MFREQKLSSRLEDPARFEERLLDIRNSAECPSTEYGIDALIRERNPLGPGLQHFYRKRRFGNRCPSQFEHAFLGL
ncbi:hypothetical protein BC443_16120 [Salinicola sp. MIT1003]|nr:hypothetical protein BC443_16120 [Salinicola sp. MIT1003]